MGLLSAAANDDWFTVMTAFLNVLQTVALAYLAADRHTVNALRRQSVGTRSGDVKP